jgi:alkyl hydroperoxide reductase subunit AhpC|tara:strand:- start:4203 stop:4454 length:252 start_codon:yes stop_codon:yes gene_type:complete
VDSRPSLNQFSGGLGNLTFPLLADFWPHGGVGQAYGVFNDERGNDARSVFIIDRDGVIQWTKVYEPGNLPEHAELLAELAKIS